MLPREFHLRVREVGVCDGWYLSSIVARQDCAHHRGGFALSLTVTELPTIECVWEVDRVERSGVFGLYTIRAKQSSRFISFGSERTPLVLREDATHPHSEWSLVAHRPDRTIVFCPEHGAPLRPWAWQLSNCPGSLPIITLTGASNLMWVATFIELEPVVPR
jgi:hypothetical protein